MFVVYYCRMFLVRSCASAITTTEKGGAAKVQHFERMAGRVWNGTCQLIVILHFQFCDGPGIPNFLWDSTRQIIPIGPERTQGLYIRNFRRDCSRQIVLPGRQKIECGQIPQLGWNCS